MRFWPLIMLSVLVVGCSESEDSDARIPELPRFSGEELAKGRGIWMGTCRNCHLLGISDAPAVTDALAWNPRISKGKAALYESALKGMMGESGEYRMPPRGGNPQLKDEQVRLAVDFMVAAVAELAKRK